ncbi:MAG: hypothetical protein FWE21_09340 [Defluviitaleaceae bacterium]|nr:hypothetical protein [Defluviitaleaceae bacterium]
MGRKFLGKSGFPRKSELVKRLLSEPNDFNFAELKLLLIHCGIFDASVNEAMKSAVFTDRGEYIRLHKTDLCTTLKPYQIKEIAQFLRERGEL